MNKVTVFRFSVKIKVIAFWLYSSSAPPNVGGEFSHGQPSRKLKRGEAAYKKLRDTVLAKKPKLL
jgi:hypothetical protein